MKKLFVSTLIILACLAFTTVLHHDDYRREEPVPIPASPQRVGQKDIGYQYLTTGDYIKSGIPYNYFLLGFGRNVSNLLKRDSPNHLISQEYTAVKAPNGEIVVAPNCLQCHAQVFEDKLYIGLGNTTIDFTDHQKLNARNASMAEALLKKGDPKKYTAAAPFLQSMKVLGNQLYTEVRGVNSADRIADLLVAHRDPATLRWSDTPVIDVAGGVIPTDTPPWWLLKKKHAMFYNGFGRGDFGRFLMASNLLTVSDSAEAREVDSHINDVLAYIYSLEPPKYPQPINQTLAKQGGVIFVQNCSKCHGHYDGEGGDYPNLLIPESTIGTDSFLYKSNYQSPQFIDWFNKSWFAMGDHPARLEPFSGYIAPPLDGIWITAPYLHNGSVPTLEALLNSKTRPAYWSRDFNNPQYDYDHVGWKYTRETAPRGKSVYNTTLDGYGNYGHTFGDKLTDKERKAVIEYLKTL
ncbi:MAG: c-type cytochrome [Chitinophagaceae bacterium]|nr:c-type cytochrome [Chitinophagaceae bacterium]